MSKSYTEIKCFVCGKSKEHLTCRVKKGLAKYCSQECSQKAQKGTKKPHSKEWEEKRIQKVRENSYKWAGKSRPKSKETIQIALKVLEQKRFENPGKYSTINTKNLPKDVSGDKNPNFRDWATKKSNNFRIKNSSRFKKWSKDVFERDGGKCRQCGTSEGTLDAHHIIEISKTVKPAFELWNGVLLCRKCHSQTKSFGGHSKRVDVFNDGSSKLNILILTIPHMFQEYNTVGNYKTIDDETYILVSDTGNEFYNRLIAIHELIEEALTKHRGLTEPEIMDFDLYYEKRRDQGLVPEDSEPGFDPNAPYLKEHTLATSVEMMMCALAGESWTDYDRTVMTL